MNKASYFAELSQALSDLPSKERDDILRDIEEHFHEGKMRGLSEDDIVEKLGSPKKMADTLLTESKINQISQAETLPKKATAILSATVAILLLAPFNFLFILLPLLIIAFFLGGFWIIAFGLLLTLPIMCILALFGMMHVGIHLIALLSLIFLLLGWGSIVMAYTVGLIMLTVLLFKAIYKLFQWNIHFVKKQMRD